MESIREDIHTELQRLRLDKRHIYNTLLRIIDTLPQAPEVVEETPVVPVAPKKSTKKKKKVTITV